MKDKLKIYLLLLMFSCVPMLARAQGTAFSYQGHLQNQGAAPTAAYDFVFALFDDAAAGNQIGINLPLANIAVVSGRFNVTLDFGQNAFTASARWLEISVRPAGMGNYTKMDGRVSLLPTPYAIHASTASSVADGVVTANQLNTGGFPPTEGQLLTYSGGNLLWADAGVAVGNIWSKNGADTYYSAGNVGIGLSSPTPGVRLEVNGNVRLHPNGGIPGGYFQFGTPSGETGLSISGANRADIRFDDSTLKLLAGLGTGAMPAENGIAITTAGNVGIGTNTPATGVRLEVNGTTKVNAGGNGGYVYLHTPGGESGLSVIGTNRADIRFDGSSLKLLAGFGPGAMPATNGIVVTTDGDVGIGTTNPIAKLHVESLLTSKSALFGREHGPAGIGVYGEATASSGAGVFARNLNGVALQADGNVIQTRDKGGTVKAMVLIHYDGSIPSFVRGYNGVTGASTGQCGFTYDHYLTSPVAVLHTTINFGFQVSDRFISLTAISGQTPQGVSVFGFPDANTIDIRNDGDFYLIVY